MSIGYIYQLISPSGKRYIGSTIQTVKKRVDTHVYLLDKNKHPNPILQNAWIKYKKFTVNVIEEVEFVERKELIDREQYYLDTLKPEYNIAINANSPSNTESVRKKIGDALRGRKRGKLNISERGKEIQKHKGDIFKKAIVGRNIITEENVEFTSCHDAADKLGFSFQLISKQINLGRLVGDYVLIYEINRDNLDNTISLEKERLSKSANNKGYVIKEITFPSPNSVIE